MKAISPFVALVLLIALVISIAVILGRWYSDFLKRQTEIVAGGAEERIICEDAGIKLFAETISCDFSGNGTLENPEHLNFTVKNSGRINLYDLRVEVSIGGVVERFYLQDAATNLTFTKASPLKPGESATLRANVTKDMPLADASWIKVITQCPGKDSGRIENIDCTP